MSVGPDGVVFRGDVQVPDDSDVTSEAIMEVLSDLAAEEGSLTDGQTYLSVDPQISATGKRQLCLAIAK